ncbi:hypothetical protein BT96DRAFT_973316 [Gymnopus androsaceus JB14]|uniref:Uncharacterized protein n=1 Tax=Gymnopus androsaceus JB14 TaxID=1447944 RepID=A0A6A4I5R0_9AGAR|nr:hypothetical protein BT96DRAFT_973316 [Gymnopus androsaceus JB14]
MDPVPELRDAFRNWRARIENGDGAPECILFLLPEWYDNENECLLAHIIPLAKEYYNLDYDELADKLHMDDGQKGYTTTSVRFCDLDFAPSAGTDRLNAAVKALFLLVYTKTASLSHTWELSYLIVVPETEATTQSSG